MSFLCYCNLTPITLTPITFVCFYFPRFCVSSYKYLCCLQSEVGVDMLLVILGCLKMPETLCRDNSLWRFLVEWLRHADPVWLASDLLPKLDDSVVAWLQSSTDLSGKKQCCV